MKKYYLLFLIGIIASCQSVQAMDNVLNPPPKRARFANTYQTSELNMLAEVVVDELPRRRMDISQLVEKEPPAIAPHLQIKAARPTSISRSTHSSVTPVLPSLSTHSSVTPVLPPFQEITSVPSVASHQYHNPPQIYPIVYDYNMYLAYISTGETSAAEFILSNIIKAPRSPEDKVRAHLTLSEIYRMKEILLSKSPDFEHYYQAIALDQTGEIAYKFSQLLHQYGYCSTPDTFKPWERLSELVTRILFNFPGYNNGYIFNGRKEKFGDFYLFLAANQGWQPAQYDIAVSLYSKARTIRDCQNVAELMFHLACKEYIPAVCTFKSWFKLKEKYYPVENLVLKHPLDIELFRKRGQELLTRCREIGASTPTILNLNKHLNVLYVFIEKFSTFPYQYASFQARASLYNEVKALRRLNVGDKFISFVDELKGLQNWLGQSSESPVSNFFAIPLSKEKENVDKLIAGLEMIKDELFAIEAAYNSHSIDFEDNYYTSYLKQACPWLFQD